MSATECYCMVIYKNESFTGKKKTLVKFIQNYIWDPSGVFSIFSLVRILMTSFRIFHGCLCKK